MMRTGLRVAVDGNLLVKGAGQAHSLPQASLLSGGLKDTLDFSGEVPTFGQIQGTQMAG